MAPPSLSAMSMSVTPPTASSDSFVRDDSNFQKFTSSVDLSLGVNTYTAEALLPGAESGYQTQQECTPREGEEKKVLSDEEILRRRSAGEALVLVDGNVYNVSEFLETHPGSAEVLDQSFPCHEVSNGQLLLILGL